MKHRLKQCRNPTTKGQLSPPELVGKGLCNTHGYLEEFSLVAMATSNSCLPAYV